jgi:hypothetical protein
MRDSSLRFDRPAVRAAKRPLSRCVPGGALVILLAAVLLPSGGRLRENSPRLVDVSHVRQIAQATFLYAADHGGRLPVAANPSDYAAELARDGLLNDASVWFSTLDPAREGETASPGLVLRSDGMGAEPAFLRARLSWAVPLGEWRGPMDETTPVAWTRGLRPDGTWAAHGPYGGEGGYIAFFGGETRFFRKLTPKKGVMRFGGGKGMTADIRDALPPGVVIGEYVPTKSEAAAWSERNRRRAEAWADRGWSDVGLFAGFLLLLVAVLTAVALAVVLVLDVVRTRRRARRL